MCPTCSRMPRCGPASSCTGRRQDIPVIRMRPCGVMARVCQAAQRQQVAIGRQNASRTSQARQGDSRAEHIVAEACVACGNNSLGVFCKFVDRGGLSRGAMRAPGPCPWWRPGPSGSTGRSRQPCQRLSSREFAYWGPIPGWYRAQNIPFRKMCSVNDSSITRVVRNRAAQNLKEDGGVAVYGSRKGNKHERY